MVQWQYTPYFLPLIIAAIIAIVIASITWQRRHVSGAIPLSILMLAVAVWSLGNVLELGSTELSAKLFWVNLEYLGIVFIPVMWITFALQYTGSDKWITKRNLFLLIIVPLITLILLWTNSLHGLVRQNIGLDTSGPFSVVTKTYGIWFGIHAAYSYLLLFSGTLILVQTLFRKPDLYWKQGAILVIGAVAPWIANILYISGSTPIPPLDLTPCFFVISGLMLAWGIFRLKFLDIIPMTRTVIIENLNDGIILLDAQNRIIDLNSVSQKILNCKTTKVIGQPITQLFPNLIKLGSDTKKTETEIVRGNDKAKNHYNLHISPLDDHRGYLLVIHEITKQKQTETTLQESKQKIEALHKTAHRLEACENEQKIYQLTIQTAKTILDFSTHSLSTIENGKMVTKIASPDLPPELHKHANFNEEMNKKTHRSGKTYVFSNFGRKKEMELVQKYFQSAISAPIGDIGVVQLFSTKPNAFTKDDARILELLLGHSTEALKRIRLQNKLKKQAIHDPLTNLHNRYYFMEVINREIERSKRYKHPIAFLMIDVNRFKEINDRFGHQIGDIILQEVGKILQKQVRKIDIVVRYGGDEFLIVLSAIKGDAQVAIKRIRQAIANWNKKSPISNFPITLAIGLSYWYPEQVKSIDAVLSEADRGMYEDKKKQKHNFSEKILPK